MFEVLENHCTSRIGTFCTSYMLLILSNFNLVHPLLSFLNNHNAGTCSSMKLCFYSTYVLLFPQRLGYDGLGRLLGMGKTAGTIPDGLPPPRSELMSSIMNLHQPHVSSTAMTLRVLFPCCLLQTYSCTSNLGLTFLCVMSTKV